MRVGIAFCLLLVACAKKPAEQDVARPVDSAPAARPADSSTQVVIAGDSAAAAKPAPPPAKPDCTVVEDIMSDVHSAFMAKNTGAPRKAAAKAWPTVPDACKNGEWYLAAALLITAGEAELNSGSIKIATEESALTLALAQPDDIEVLKRVALMTGLGRKPTLPADACKRAKAVAGSDANAAAYVCGRASIAAGDGKTAKQELDAIKSTTGFADVELARAQAAQLNKDAKTRKAQAKLAMKLDSTRANAALIRERDRKAIIDLAKPLSK
jgi:hypothetical protein